MRAETLGILHGAKINRTTPHISHLLFADDTMVFSRASEEEVNVVVYVVDTFSVWSGQTLNLQKSSVFFSKNVA